MFVEKVVTGPDGDKLGFGLWSGTKVPDRDGPGGYNAGIVLRADPEAPSGVTRLYSLMLYGDGDGQPLATVFIAADQSREPGGLRFAEPTGEAWRKPLAKYTSPVWFGEPAALRLGGLDELFPAAAQAVAGGAGTSAAVSLVRKLAGESGLPAEFVRNLRTFLADLS